MINVLAKGANRDENEMQLISVYSCHVEILQADFHVKLVGSDFKLYNPRDFG